MTDPSQFLVQLRRDGWVRTPTATLKPLTGGVSSEIYLVKDGDDQFVVKRALAKLKVKDDWFADIGRNASERDFLACVGCFMPDAVPRMRFANPAEGYFGMEYLGDGFANWKMLLLGGFCDVTHARMAGRIMGGIHRMTYGRKRLRSRFDTDENFHQLRISPYLLTTGDQHPDLHEAFIAESLRLETTHECLVHGDFSPKNILINGGRMVLLDCEVAWYGDPAFDVAFLLNHIHLKAARRSDTAKTYHNLVTAFDQAYAEALDDKMLHVTITSRVAVLLPMLMLARIDGKSPVEYLNEPIRERIRRFTIPRIATPCTNWREVSKDWFSHFSSQ